MSMAIPKTQDRKPGLAFWMERVLQECDRASTGFAPDPVHDLRVALRRCRSMVDGLMAMDPDPAWKQMKKAGKRLFSSLGDLRDVHVMEEWVHHFDSPGDLVATKMLQYLALRQTHLKQQATQALQEFDRKQWRKWSGSLPRRAGRLRPGSLIFKHLALERWTDAHELHGRALRNRSQVAWHSLRIGIKRFRYIVENFLPEQHALWGDDLKKLQDLLGEVHDLDVLWVTAQQAHVFPDDAARSHWHTRLHQESEQRIASYREKMVGETSLWQVWRAQLPQGKQIESAALQRLRRWAAVLDPDFKHSNHVTRLSLQLYDGLIAIGGKVRPPEGRAREILRLAALLHDVGRSKEGKGHHKTSYRLIERLKPPLGIEGEVLRMAGVVARYHRGAMPRAGQKALQNLIPTERNEVFWLAGILRLTNAFDADRKSRVSRLEVRPQDGFILIAAQGYSSHDRSAEEIAAARHLLELVCRRPVMVKALRAGTST
jgi:CHAD domain-containing protein